MLFTIKSSSMLTVVIIFTWLNIITNGAIAQYYTYNVTVKTSSTIKFNDHNGKLKININYQNSTAIKGTSKLQKENFILTPEDVKIDMNRNYTSMIHSFARLANITSIDLRWTLATPYNPTYLVKKPVIYFDWILLSYSYNDLNSHLIVTLTSKYCPSTTPIGIKHKAESTFYPCKLVN